MKQEVGTNVWIFAQYRSLIIYLWFVQLFQNAFLTMCTFDDVDRLPVDLMIYGLLSFSLSPSHALDPKFV